MQRNRYQNEIQPLSAKNGLETENNFTTMLPGCLKDRVKY